MPTLERAGAKHNELVKQLTRTRAKRDKTVATLARLEAKHNSLIRAVTRSQKRLGKLRIVTSVHAPMTDVFNDSEVLTSGQKSAPALRRSIWKPRCAESTVCLTTSIFRIFCAVETRRPRQRGRLFHAPTSRGSLACVPCKKPT